MLFLRLAHVTPVMISSRKHVAKVSSFNSKQQTTERFTVVFEYVAVHIRLLEVRRGLHVQNQTVGGRLKALCEKRQHPTWNENIICAK